MSSSYTPSMSMISCDSLASSTYNCNQTYSVSMSSSYTPSLSMIWCDSLANFTYNRNQTYSVSMSSSYTPSVSMIWCDSLASSISNSFFSNLQLNIMVLSLFNSPVVEYIIAIKLIQCQCLHNILHQCLWFGMIHWHLSHIIAIKLIQCQCLHHIFHQCLLFGVIHWHLTHIIAIKLPHVTVFIISSISVYGLVWFIGIFHIRFC